MALVNCKHCEKEFDNYVDYDGYRTISTPREYCSKRCLDRQHSRKPPIDTKKLIRKCKGCGKKFNAKKNYDGTYAAHPLWYHSQECKIEAKRAKNAERFRNRYVKKEKPKKLSWRYRRKSDEQ